MYTGNENSGSTCMSRDSASQTLGGRGGFSREVLGSIQGYDRGSTMLVELHTYVVAEERMSW